MESVTTGELHTAGTVTLKHTRVVDVLDAIPRKSRAWPNVVVVRAQKIITMHVNAQSDWYHMNWFNTCVVIAGTRVHAILNKAAGRNEVDYANRSRCWAWLAHLPNVRISSAVGTVVAASGAVMNDDRKPETSVVSGIVLIFPCGSCYGVVCVFVLSWFASDVGKRCPSSSGVGGGKIKTHKNWSSVAGVVAAQKHGRKPRCDTVPLPSEGVCSYALA